MVKKYSDDEIAEFTDFYAEHGVVKLPGLIEPEWVSKIGAEIDRATTHVNDTRAPDQALSFGTAPGRMTIRHQWRENPVVRDFLLRPELAEPIARIVGAKTLRFWFDLTFIHDGSPDGEKGVGTDWHHDIAAFGFKGEQLPSLWMAMTPATQERSRLMFIDGSHTSTPGFYRTPGSPGLANGVADGMLTIPDFDTLIAEGKEKVITWDCDPGDAIILHPFVIHGASGNQGAKNAGRRVAITTRWLGDDVRYLPTNGPGAQQVPGVPENPVVVGGRPRGQYFPQVYPTLEVFDAPSIAEAA